MVKRYLSVMPLADTLTLLAREFPCIPSAVQVPLEEATGRITSGPIFARYSVPEIHLAAMDGIAVRSVIIRRDLGKLLLRFGSRSLLGERHLTG